MKKGNSKILLLLALLVIFVVLLLLMKKREADGDVVKIGVVMPQTGFLASPGKNVIEGINLFVNEFNVQNSKKKIKVIYEDSKSEPKVGVNALNKLINIDRVKIVIGDLGSPIFLAMAPVAEQNRVVMISPGASNPKVREAGDFIFRIYTSDDFDGKIMANYLINKKKTSKIALLHMTNDYGLGLSNAFSAEYGRLEGTIVFNYSFDENSQDFRDAIIKLKEKGIRDVYFIGSPKQDASFLRQLKEANCDVNIYGVLSFEDNEFLSIAKNSFEKVEYTTSYFDLDSESEKMQSFKEAYQKEYKKLPDLNSALGYDVIEIIMASLANCNYEIERLKDEIYKIKDFPSLTGNTTFDEKGDVVKDVMIKEVKGDGTQKVLEIIKMRN